MPDVISLINFKGGVAKTSSAVNIAADLAKYQKRKTLLIDLDPQSNASLWLMGVSRFEPTMKGNKNVYGLFQDHIKGGHDFEFEEARIESVVRKLSYGSYSHPIPKLDLLPATYRMVKLENELTQVDNKHKILQKGLKDATKDYDYVIIDCPPNVYSVTRNALFWSDYYIIPAIPDFLSNVGLSILTHEIQDFLDRTADERPHGKSAACLGVIFTKVRYWYNEHKQQKASVKTALNELIKDDVVESDAEIFEPDVRDAVSAQAAAGRFLPLSEFKPRDAVSEDYKELAAKIDTKVQSK